MSPSNGYIDGVWRFMSLVRLQKHLLPGYPERAARKLTRIYDEGKAIGLQKLIRAR